MISYVVGYLVVGFLFALIGKMIGGEFSYSINEGGYENIPSLFIALLWPIFALIALYLFICGKNVY